MLPAQLAGNAILRQSHELADGAGIIRRRCYPQLAVNVDLVISDWNMDLTGEQVRANEKSKHLPSIMMTADSTINKVAQAKNSRVSCLPASRFVPRHSRLRF